MTTVLLDSNNLAVRSFHAAKHSMTSDDGIETGALQLFVTGLSRYLREFPATHLVACWDGGGSEYREKIYPDYKLARRKAQDDHRALSGSEPYQSSFWLIREFLDLMGIAQWRQQGVEADDLIAAAHRRTRSERPDDQIVILSADKDLLQLLDDHTLQMRFSGWNTGNDVWTPERVVSDLGYRPDQIPYMMAFTGDQSDGVPGSVGIGPKKALKLLEQHDWDFEAAADTRPDAMMVWVSYDLVNLLGDLPCEVEPVPEFTPLRRSQPDSRKRFEDFTAFCAQYQMVTLWDRVVADDLW